MTSRVVNRRPRKDRPLYERGWECFAGCQKEADRIIEVAACGEHAPMEHLIDSAYTVIMASRAIKKWERYAEAYKIKASPELLGRLRQDALDATAEYYKDPDSEDAA